MQVASGQIEIMNGWSLNLIIHFYEVALGGLMQIGQINYLARLTIPRNTNINFIILGYYSISIQRFIDDVYTNIVKSTLMRHLTLA